MSGDDKFKEGVNKLWAMACEFPLGPSEKEAASIHESLRELLAVDPRKLRGLAIVSVHLGDADDANVQVQLFGSPPAIAAAYLELKPRGQAALEETIKLVVKTHLMREDVAPPLTETFN